MKRGVDISTTRYFLAPYEWYNSVISGYAADMGVRLINFTPGTGTNADYTTPDMVNYRSSEYLVNQLKNFGEKSPEGLKGAFILIHPGTESSRTDKLYNKLEELISYFTSKGYKFDKL
jgi:peptidoglycan/xylan/chitin deacetylase (PgdA/CDA1 family)